MKLEKSINQTNVIWSFDSSRLTEDLLQSICTSDVDAVRIVGGGHGYRQLIENARLLKKRFDASGKVVPVLVDAVPKARGNICNLKGEQELVPDQIVCITPEGKGGDLEFASANWNSFFRQDELVYLGNGLATLMPVEISDGNVQARVVQGGTIFPSIEVHCPPTRQPLKFDELNLDEYRAYAENSVDGIVIQGLTTPDEMGMLKKELRNASESPPWIILKIDSENSYRNLRELIPHIKGVLISRIELGMSMEPAKVPMITKEVIQLCNDKAKIVMVASEILGSMRHNATPTRAEVSDIANAAMDGADGVVLSEDLGLGSYAVRGLELAKKIIGDIEGQRRFHDLNWVKHGPEINHTLAAVTYTGYRTAHRNNAKAIVCLTNKGNTALLLASFRTNIPIFAVTLSTDVLRRLALIRGVHGLLLEDAPSIDEVLPMINNRIVRDTWLKPGEKIVFVSVSLSSVGEKASNLFTVQTLQ